MSESTPRVFIELSPETQALLDEASTGRFDAGAVVNDALADLNRDLGRYLDALDDRAAAQEAQGWLNSSINDFEMALMVAGIDRDASEMTLARSYQAYMVDTALLNDTRNLENFDRVERQAGRQLDRRDFSALSITQEDFEALPETQRQIVSLQLEHHASLLDAQGSTALTNDIAEQLRSGDIEATAAILERQITALRAEIDAMSFGGDQTLLEASEAAASIRLYETLEQYSAINAILQQDNVLAAAEDGHNAYWLEAQNTALSLLENAETPEEAAFAQQINALFQEIKPADISYDYTQFGYATAQPDPDVRSQFEIENDPDWLRAVSIFYSEIDETFVASDTVEFFNDPANAHYLESLQNGVLPEDLPQEAIRDLSNWGARVSRFFTMNTAVAGDIALGFEENYGGEDPTAAIAFQRMLDSYNNFGYFNSWRATGETAEAIITDPINIAAIGGGLVTGGIGGAAIRGAAESSKIGLRFTLARIVQNHVLSSGLRTAAVAGYAEGTAAGLITNSAEQVVQLSSGQREDYSFSQAVVASQFEAALGVGLSVGGHFVGDLLTRGSRAAPETAAPAPSIAPAVDAAVADVTGFAPQAPTPQSSGLALATGMGNDIAPSFRAPEMETPAGIADEAIPTQIGPRIPEADFQVQAPEAPTLPDFETSLSSQSIRPFDGAPSFELPPALRAAEGEPLPSVFTEAAGRPIVPGLGDQLDTGLTAPDVADATLDVTIPEATPAPQAINLPDAPTQPVQPDVDAPVSGAFETRLARPAVPGTQTPGFGYGSFESRIAASPLGVEGIGSNSFAATINRSAPDSGRGPGAPDTPPSKPDAPVIPRRPNGWNTMEAAERADVVNAWFLKNPDEAYRFMTQRLDEAEMLGAFENMGGGTQTSFIRRLHTEAPDQAEILIGNITDDALRTRIESRLGPDAQPARAAEHPQPEPQPTPEPTRADEGTGAGDADARAADADGAKPKDGAASSPDPNAGNREVRVIRRENETETETRVALSDLTAADVKGLNKNDLNTITMAEMKAINPDVWPAVRDNNLIRYFGQDQRRFIRETLSKNDTVERSGLGRRVEAVRAFFREIGDDRASNRVNRELGRNNSQLRTLESQIRDGTNPDGTLNASAQRAQNILDGFLGARFGQGPEPNLINLRRFDQAYERGVKNNAPRDELARLRSNLDTAYELAERQVDSAVSRHRTAYNALTNDTDRAAYLENLIREHIDSFPTEKEQNAAWRDLLTHEHTILEVVSGLAHGTPGISQTRIRGILENTYSDFIANKSIPFINDTIASPEITHMSRIGLVARKMSEMFNSYDTGSMGWREGATAVRAIFDTFERQDALRAKYKAEGMNSNEIDAAVRKEIGTQISDQFTVLLNSGASPLAIFWWARSARIKGLRPIIRQEIADTTGGIAQEVTGDMNRANLFEILFQAVSNDPVSGFPADPHRVRWSRELIGHMLTPGRPEFSWAAQRLGANLSGIVPEVFGGSGRMQFLPDNETVLGYLNPWNYRNTSPVRVARFLAYDIWGGHLISSYPRGFESPGAKAISMAIGATSLGLVYSSAIDHAIDGDYDLPTSYIGAVPAEIAEFGLNTPLWFYGTIAENAYHNTIHQAGRWAFGHDPNFRLSFDGIDVLSTELAFDPAFRSATIPLVFGEDGWLPEYGGHGNDDEADPADPANPADPAPAGAGTGTGTGVNPPAATTPPAPTGVPIVPRNGGLNLSPVIPQPGDTPPPVIAATPDERAEVEQREARIRAGAGAQAPRSDLRDIVNSALGDDYDITPRQAEQVGTLTRGARNIFNNVANTVRGVFSSISNSGPWGPWLALGLAVLPGIMVFRGALKIAGAVMKPRNWAYALGGAAVIAAATHLLTSSDDDNGQNREDGSFDTSALGVSPAETRGAALTQSDSAAEAALTRPADARELPGITFDLSPEALAYTQAHDAYVASQIAMANADPDAMPIAALDTMRVQGHADGSMPALYTTVYNPWAAEDGYAFDRINATAIAALAAAEMGAEGANYIAGMGSGVSGGFAPTSIAQMEIVAQGDEARKESYLPATLQPATEFVPPAYQLLAMAGIGEDAETRMGEGRGTTGAVTPDVEADAENTASGPVTFASLMENEQPQIG